VSATSLGKDLLELEPLSAEQIRLILDTAEPFKEVSERRIKKVPALRGKTIVNLFFEASTRTRISFDLAEKRLTLAQASRKNHARNQDTEATGNERTEDDGWEPAHRRPVQAAG